jgi:hypothetical protein
MKSSAATVEAYLAEQPEERRETLSAVRDVILRNLPEGYAERMNWGVISYEVPLERYPKTYNGQPLMYAGLAAQKNYLAVYLMGIYGDGKEAGWFREAFKQAGKKLDMGKSCVRFRTLDDLPLDAIGRAVAATTVEQYIAVHEAARAKAGRARGQGE